MPTRYGGSGIENPDDTFIGSVLAESVIGGSDDVSIIGGSGNNGDTDVLIGGANLPDLSTIDANSTLAGNQAFVFVDSAALTSAGQVRFATNGTSSFVLDDPNSDGVADLNALLSGVTSLTAADFILQRGRQRAAVSRRGLYIW